MKLTLTERWILSNQYRILKALHKGDDEFDQALEAIESGYELEYDQLIPHIYADTFSREECRRVRDIMAMFSVLKYSYNQLQEKTGIKQQDIIFDGFSGNEETLHMAYTRWLYEDRRFRDLDRGDDFNSHFPTLERYTQMLRIWESMGKKHELTREEVIKIVSR